MKELGLLKCGSSAVLGFHARDCSADKIAFLCGKAGGFVRLLLPLEIADKIGLQPIGCDQQGFLMTDTIEASKGVSTGISAADRNVTVKAATCHPHDPSAISIPGHLPVALLDTKNSPAARQLASQNIEEAWVFATMLDQQGACLNFDLARKLNPQIANAAK